MDAVCVCMSTYWQVYSTAFKLAKKEGKVGKEVRDFAYNARRE